VQITRRADYAVRTMMDVAGLGEGATALTREVASRQLLPAAFLAKIVRSLTQAGLLRAYRGSGGGITLSRPPEEITLLQVVEAVDGPISVKSCVLWPEECYRAGGCAVHGVWCEVQRLLVQHLSGTTVASLVERERVPRPSECGDEALPYTVGVESGA